MAISKQRKDELVAAYTQWLNNSQAVFVTEYIGLSMKQLDELRSKVREAGGELHIVKNTLGKIALDAAEMPGSDQVLKGSTAFLFAFQDAPGMAKAVADYARTSEFVKIKGGYLGKNYISPDEVKALAELPPLPVMRAQLLGVLNAPASKLARTLAEPARQLAAVFKAYAEKDAAPVAA